MRVLCARAAAVALLSLADAAGAATFDFWCITGNLAGDCAIGEAQLSVDVIDASGGQVMFSFHNIGPAASSITDVYFEDGHLLGIASVLNSSGVDFAQDATPPDLPGGSNITPPFHVTEGFLADSSPPAQPNGVNPGESLGIVFSLKSGASRDNVLADLGTGKLRIGIHVQGYSSGGSESFVNQPIGVPESDLLGLLAATGATLALVRTRAPRGLRAASP